MVTRREADRVFRECLPPHLRRAWKKTRIAWFQTLTMNERFRFLGLVQQTIIDRHGEFPRPLPIKRRFPHTDPSQIQIISLPKSKRLR